MTYPDSPLAVPLSDVVRSSGAAHPVSTDKRQQDCAAVRPPQHGLKFRVTLDPPSARHHLSIQMLPGSSASVLITGS